MNLNTHVAPFLACCREFLITNRSLHEWRGEPFETEDAKRVLSSILSLAEDDSIEELVARARACRLTADFGPLPQTTVDAIMVGFIVFANAALGLSSGWSLYDIAEGMGRIEPSAPWFMIWHPNFAATMREYLSQAEHLGPGTAALLHTTFGPPRRIQGPIEIPGRLPAHLPIAEHESAVGVVSEVRLQGETLWGKVRWRDEPGNWPEIRPFLVFKDAPRIDHLFVTSEKGPEYCGKCGSARTERHAPSCQNASLRMTSLRIIERLSQQDTRRQRASYHALALDLGIPRELVWMAAEGLARDGEITREGPHLSLLCLSADRLRKGLTEIPPFSPPIPPAGRRPAARPFAEDRRPSPLQTLKVEVATLRSAATAWLDAPGGTEQEAEAAEKWFAATDRATLAADGVIEGIHLLLKNGEPTQSYLGHRVLGLSMGDFHKAPFVACLDCGLELKNTWAEIPEFKACSGPLPRFEGELEQALRAVRISAKLAEATGSSTRIVTLERHEGVPILTAERDQEGKWMLHAYQQPPIDSGQGADGSIYMKGGISHCRAFGVRVGDENGLDPYIEKPLDLDAIPPAPVRVTIVTTRAPNPEMTGPMRWAATQERTGESLHVSVEGMGEDESARLAEDVATRVRALEGNAPTVPSVEPEAK